MNYVSNAARWFGVAVLAMIAAGAARSQDLNSIFPLLPPSVSTVASNGDVNPYGVAFVPKNIVSGWTLEAGDILVSNFNNNENLQGLGTTIVRIDKTGKASTFYKSSKTGLSAAIGVLSDGIVLVGNLPTLDGTAATARPGALSVLDGNGDFLGTFGTIASVDGPWGMAVYDTGSNGTGTAHVFLSNVLNGTVSRFDMSYSAAGIGANVVTVASGLSHRPDPAALELGPSGLAYDSVHDVLYVANSEDNSIYTVSTAVQATGPVTPALLIQDLVHLHGPLDLTILPNGHLVVANSDGSNVDPNQPSELVEYTAEGQFLNQMSLDPNPGGAFGLSTYNIGWGTFRMAAVDDNTNTLNIWTAVAQ